MDNLEALEALAAQQAAQEAASKAAPKGRPSTPSGDADIKDMLAEVDLLRVIQTDTGEQGTPSGDRVDFAHCPVCGHNGCFSFYPESNSWYCFGASNTTGYEGGSALEYYKATRRADDTEAVKWLRQETGHPFEPTRKGDTQGDKRTEQGSDYYKRLAEQWPIVDTDLEHLPPLKPELVRGLIRVGRKGIIAGASKSHKSWLALNLGLSVATGGDFLGFPCKKGRVLYLNMEIAADSFPHRIADVCKAKGITSKEVTAKGMFRRIDMRGYYEGADKLAQIIYAQVSSGDLDLIILDPLYKAFNGDENSAQEVGAFCKAVDQICERIGCAFVYVHHHSKGAKGDVASIDRASGSGVFARDPDMILDVVKIEPGKDGENPLGENDRAYMLTFDLREFVSPKPIHTLYRDKLHTLDTEGITADWTAKGAQSKGGDNSAITRKAKAEAKRLQDDLSIAAYFIRNAIGAEGVPISQLARDVFGTDRTERVKKVVDSSEVFGTHNPSRNRCLVVPLKPPPSKPPSLDL